MVVLIEYANLLQGVLTMASRPSSSSGDEDDFRQHSPVDRPGHDESVLRSEDGISYYAHHQAYFAHMPIANFPAFPYSYAMYASVPQEEGFLVDIYNQMSGQQSLPLLENYQESHQTAATLPGTEEARSIAAVVESDEEQVEQTWEFLHLCDRSSCNRPCPAHPTLLETWTFDFPTELCGRLIGKKGRNMRKIMQQTKAHIKICEEERNETRQFVKVCGTELQILDAVSAIEDLFARKSSMQRLKNSRVLPIVGPRDSKIVARQMELPSDRDVSVVISSVINAGHFYLVIPRATGASFRDDFEKQINTFYNSGHIPKLNSMPLPVGMYCAGSICDKWYRVQVISSFVKAGKVEVLLLDYGHFAIIPFASLRQMRADFLDVPFQAIECCLANIVPQNGDCFFSLSDTNMFEKLTDGKKLRAVCRGIRSGISYVELYSSDNDTLTSINQRLVECGIANWVDMAF